jgi:hypothetical protein
MNRLWIGIALATDLRQNGMVWLLIDIRSALDWHWVDIGLAPDWNGLALD